MRRSSFSLFLCAGSVLLCVSAQTAFSASLPGAAASRPVLRRLETQVSLTRIQMRRRLRLSAFAQHGISSPVSSVGRHPPIKLYFLPASLRVGLVTASSSSSLPAASSPSSFSFPSIAFSSSSASSLPAVPFLPERDAILLLVNEARSQAGVAPLALHPLLNLSAERMAEDMQARHFFSHEDPDGRSSLDRIRAVGYLTAPCACSWQYWTGENIAEGQMTADQVMHDWMHSPEHRDNILSPNFNDIGIGRAGNYWVQNFGRVSG